MWITIIILVVGFCFLSLLQKRRIPRLRKFWRRYIKRAVSKKEIEEGNGYKSGYKKRNN